MHEIDSDGKRIKRLVVDLSKEQHHDIKMRAATRNISIKKWVMRAIMQQIKRENQYE